MAGVIDAMFSGRLVTRCRQVFSCQHGVAVLQRLLAVEAEASRLLGQHLEGTFELDEPTEVELASDTAIPRARMRPAACHGTGLPPRPAGGRARERGVVCPAVTRQPLS